MVLGKGWQPSLVLERKKLLPCLQGLICKGKELASEHLRIGNESATRNGECSQGWTMSKAGKAEGSSFAFLHLVLHASRGHERLGDPVVCLCLQSRPNADHMCRPRHATVWDPEQFPGLPGNEISQGRAFCLLSLYLVVNENANSYSYVNIVPALTLSVRPNTLMPAHTTNDSFGCGLINTNCSTGDILK